MSTKPPQKQNQIEKKPVGENKQHDDSGPNVNHSLTIPISGDDAQEEIVKILDHTTARDKQFMLGLMPVIGNLINLSEIATNGDHQLLPTLVETPHRFYHNLIKEHKDAMLGYMMLRSLHIVMTEESKKDPIEHARIILDIIKAQKEDNAESRPGSHIPDASPSAKLISGMAASSEDPERG